MDFEVIAAVCHDANRTYALRTGEDPATVHPTWDSAPAEIRESARQGVLNACAGAGPRELHELWCAFKKNNDWVYGPVRDNAAKVHPCLVPYDQLPEAQRRKDALFQAIVEALR